MAIKGKGRSKGGSRSVSVPPRRPLVIPPKPLLKRTGVRVALSIMLLAVVGVLVWAILNARKEGRVREDAQQAVVEYQNRVSAALTAKSVGQDTGTGFVILPEFGQVVSQLQTGEINADEVKPKLDTWTKDATDAATKIGGLQVGTGESAATLARISNLMRQSLLLYVGMVKTAGAALDVEKAQRDVLAASLLEQFPSAAAVFDAAWQELQALRSELGVPAPAPPQQPAGGGFPPGFAPGQGGIPPGGIPGGVPGEIPGQVPST